MATNDAEQEDPQVHPTPPDQDDVPEQGGEDVDPPKQTGQDVFEDGLVPVEPDEPPEVIAARQAEKEASEAVAAGIGNVTDPETDRILSEMTDSGVSVEDVKTILQNAVQAQQAEIGALRQQIDEIKRGVGSDGMLNSDAASIGGFPWMYYRLPNKGAFKESGRGHWITTGPGGATPQGRRDSGSYSTYLRKGMTPITKYGYIEPPTRAQAYLDQYLPILRSGGAVEFPVSQVIAFGWHRVPPIRGLKFPQYEQVKGNVKAFQCEACGQPFDYIEGDEEIGNRYRSHLMTGHKYPFREAAEAVRSLGFTTTPYKPVPVEEMMAKNAPTE